MNRIQVPIQDIAAGDIVKLRNAEERVITRVTTSKTDPYPIESNMDCSFECWASSGYNHKDGSPDELDIIEVWRETAEPVEVTAVVPDDGIRPDVKSLARRLAATDGFNPDAMTLMVDPVKHGIAVVLNSVQIQPAWMRYVNQASQIIEHVLQDQGDGWFPIETLDPKVIPSVSLWMVDGKFEYLLINVEFDGFHWVSYDRSEGGRALHTLDGKPTHYRRHAIRPVDIDKPKI